MHVEAVAEAFAQAVARDESNGQRYCVAGPERIPYTEVLDIIAQGGGIEPKPKVPIPMPLAKLGVNTVGALGLLPISPAQFTMLIEGNTCDPAAFVGDFGVVSPRFTPETLSYLARY